MEKYKYKTIYNHRIFKVHRFKLCRKIYIYFGVCPTLLVLQQEVGT